MTRIDLLSNRILKVGEDTIGFSDYIMTGTKKIKDIVKPVGLGLQVAEALTFSILEGYFRGGDQLVEMELQNQFGVSRSPLREAFRELEKKGLVDIVPRKGTFVKKITKRDIEENFPIRAALEGLAAELAIAHISDETLALMNEALTQMEKAVKEGDTQSYYTYHLQFHEIFIESSENSRLIAQLKNLRMQNIWHRYSYQYYQEDLEKSLCDHQAICKGFVHFRHSPERLRTLVEDHINIALDKFLTYLEKSE